MKPVHMLSWPCGTTERPFFMQKICRPKCSCFGRPSTFCRSMHPPSDPLVSSPDNLVCILSRVAEGLGPLKPQQPVVASTMLVLLLTRFPLFSPPLPRYGGEGERRGGGRDKMRAHHTPPFLLFLT